MFINIVKQSLLLSWEQAKARRLLRSIGPRVTVLGSGQIEQSHPYFDLATRLGGVLAQHGYAVLNGGGAGLMAAVNQGVSQHNGLAWGCQISLANEKPRSNHVHRSMRFRFLTIRKHMLLYHSQAYIFLPGGFGTLDELYELAVLMQTDQVASQPIILMDQAYWQGLMDFHRQALWYHGAISEQAYELFHVVNQPEEVLSVINACQQS